MKFKNFIKTYIVKNVGYKILALVLAFVLWIVIDNIQDPEITKNITGIPVTILNEDMIPAGEYVYTIASGDTLSVVVTGNKSIVSSLSAEDFVATADFSELSMTNAVPIHVSLSGDMSKYESKITIVQKTMSMVLTLDSIGTKAYDIELRYEGEQAEDMVIDSESLSPAQINITAPASVLNKISRAEVVVNLTDVTDGAVLRATPVVYNLGGDVVEMSNGITADIDEVSVTFAVSYTKKLALAATYSGTPATGYEVDSVTMSFESVLVKGKKDVLDSVSKIKLPSTLLNVDGATEDVSVTVNLGSYIPDGTEIYDNNINVIIKAKIKQTQQTTEEETTETETKETESKAEETTEPEVEETTEKETSK